MQEMPNDFQLQKLVTGGRISNRPHPLRIQLVAQPDSAELYGMDQQKKKKKNLGLV